MMTSLSRKELIRMMPSNGDDLEGAGRIVELGYPAVKPIMRDMVGWMRVAESPVADTFAAFFGRLGEPAVPAIQAGLDGSNGRTAATGEHAASTGPAAKARKDEDGGIMGQNTKRTYPGFRSMYWT